VQGLPSDVASREQHYNCNAARETRKSWRNALPAALIFMNTITNEQARSLTVSRRCELSSAPVVLTAEHYP
jgi:hypothetical protein